MRLRAPIIGFAVFLASCSGDGPSSTMAKALSQKFTTGVARGVGTEIRMGDVSGDWKRLYIFGPYTPVKRIQDSLGIPEAAARRLSRGIDMRDDVNLLLVRRGTDFESWSLSRASADFGPEVVGRSYDLQTAVFVVRAAPPNSWGTITVRAPAG